MRAVKKMWDIPKEEKASARAQGDGPVEALSSQHHDEYCLSAAELDGQGLHEIPGARYREK